MPSIPDTKPCDKCGKRPIVLACQVYCTHCDRIYQIQSSDLTLAVEGWNEMVTKHTNNVRLPK